MSTMELSEDTQAIIEDALKIARDHQDAELDSIHLLLSLVSFRNTIDPWLTEGQINQKQLLKQELEIQLNNRQLNKSVFPEPSERYLKILISAENQARSRGGDSIYPGDIFSAILDQDQQMAMYFSGMIRENQSRKPENQTPTLNEVGRDLTALASKNALNPVIGREVEIQQLIEVLLQRGKNSALLVGPAGTGKTAIVEGLAQKIFRGDVPSKLRSAQLIELNLGSLVAGTSYRGEFEERLQNILNELRNHREIILVMDEFHSIVGAGSIKGRGPDAVTMLKPALARGDITCIGITTDEDFVQYIEPDEALTRRFYPVHIKEPTVSETEEILKQLAPIYSSHHQIVIPDQTIDAILRWSDQYMPSRNFPDKAIDILGKACARAELREINSLTTEIIAELISEYSGISVGDLDDGFRDKLLHLEDKLSLQVIGQLEAIELLSKSVRLSYSGLRDQRRPKGVFLFVGPSGVGKTALARALASELFGSEKALIKFDMSEYSEKSNVSRLIGAAPGYLGHEQPGQLIQVLRDHPHSIVLFDEIEKASPEVFDLFLQLFDEGRITDSHGRVANGTHAFFIMTSNLGVVTTKQSEIGFIQHKGMNQPSRLVDISVFRQYFRAEFLDRIDHIIEFRDLDKEELIDISELEIRRVSALLKEQQIRLTYEADVLELIASKADVHQAGARKIKGIVESEITIPLSDLLLKSNLKQTKWINLRTVKDRIIMEFI